MNHVVDIVMWIGRNIVWINILFAILLIFFERRNPTTTWLWLMVLILLPGVGFIMYLFCGQDLSKQKKFSLKAEDDICFSEIASEQEREIENDEFVYLNPKYKDYQDLMKMHLMSSESIITQDNHVELFFNGNDKFTTLINDIKNAKESVHLQYYIFRSDGLGVEIMDALCERARAGLEVKVISDGMGARGLKKSEIKRLEEAGGKVAIFFPSLLPLINIRINYRNHRKICVIDGEIGYVGGFNIGDEYLGKYKKFGFWRDTHAKIAGSAVHSLDKRFLLDWRYASKEDVKICIHENVHLNNQENSAGDKLIQIVSSGPDSKWPSVKDGYLKMIANAKEKVYIQTPYFIPDDSILEALKLAGLSGLDVRVMMPCKPDHPFVYWAGMSYVGELLEAGVKFYTYENGFLHAKVVIMDDLVSSVGTANLDIRSFELNFEVNAFIYDEDINKQLTQSFIDDLKDCEEITKEKRAKRSNYVRIKESFSRLLSPIL